MSSTTPQEATQATATTTTNTDPNTTTTELKDPENTAVSTTNSSKGDKPKVGKSPKAPKVPRPWSFKPEGAVSRKDTGNTKQRVAILFGYLGTGYYGLQWDDKLPTIEKALEDAIFRMGGILETNYGNIDRVQWARSSRTDKGVHALGNVTSLFMELPPTAFDEDKLGLKVADKINEHLPPAIRVFSVVKVSRKFSPREQCAIRTYNIIWPRKHINETEHNLESIAKLMKYFEGYHDFHNFTRAQHCYRQFVTAAYTATPTTETTTAPPTDNSTPAPPIDDATPTPSVPEPSTTSTTTPSVEITASTTTTATAPSETSKAPKEDEESESDDADDVGVEVTNRKDGKQKQSKPRGMKAPPKREDQIAQYVQHNSYVRRIIYMAPETPFLLGGEEWIPFKFVGESFAYNQIRKMLGYVLHICRGHVPEASLPIALDGPFKISVPMTPGECLYLLGGTFLDRRHVMVDLFQFLSESGTVPEKYPTRNYLSCNFFVSSRDLTQRCLRLCPGINFWSSQQPLQYQGQ